MKKIGALDGRVVAITGAARGIGEAAARAIAAEGASLILIDADSDALERVHSMPRQGVATTFAFGAAYGCALALGNMFDEPAVLVTPNQWKKFYGLDADKNKSSALARDMWPTAPIKLKKHNGRAEALLIANYLRLRIE